MVSKNEIKLITSLAQKKYRNKHQLFVAEGVKVVNELLNSSFEIHHIYATEKFENSIDEQIITYITDKELQKLSLLTTSQVVVGVFKIPEQKKLENGGLHIVLDTIQDPGNLGTIIRLSDWFGAAQLICSTETVDCYNPKVVQATMGSLGRIPILYTDIHAFLKNSKSPIYCSLLDGKNIYNTKLPKDVLLVMGNEANGVQKSIQDLATHKITIPRFGNDSKAESLNVAMATAVFLSEYNR